MTERVPRTPATKALIGAILVGMGIEIVTGAWLDPKKLALLGAILPFDYMVKTNEWWRLVSAMFLHGNGTVGGDALHLVLNLVAVYQLGTLYELMFGTRRFLAIYFVSGIVASITSMVVTGGPSVGASGAIFGIVGGLILSILRSPRWRHERAARSIVHQVVFLAIANIVIGLQIEEIDNAAHIGGLVAGLALGALLPHRASPPPPARVVVDVMPFEEPAADPRERTDDR